MRHPFCEHLQINWILSQIERWCSFHLFALDVCGSTCCKNPDLVGPSKPLIVSIFQRSRAWNTHVSIESTDEQLMISKLNGKCVKCHNEHTTSTIVYSPQRMLAHSISAISEWKEFSLKSSAAVVLIVSIYRSFGIDSSIGHPMTQAVSFHRHTYEYLGTVSSRLWIRTGFLKEPSHLSGWKKMELKRNENAQMHVLCVCFYVLLNQIPLFNKFMCLSFSYEDWK